MVENFLNYSEEELEELKSHDVEKKARGEFHELENNQVNKSPHHGVSDSEVPPIPLSMVTVEGGDQS